MQPVYYECHITLTDLNEEDLAKLRATVYQTAFRVANFALLSDRPSAKPKMFVSMRHDDYQHIHSCAQHMLFTLKAAGLTPTRVKIESTIFDLLLVP